MKFYNNSFDLIHKNQGFGAKRNIIFLESLKISSKIKFILIISRKGVT